MRAVWKRFKKNCMWIRRVKKIRIETKIEVSRSKYINNSHGVSAECENIWTFFCIVILFSESSGIGWLMGWWLMAVLGVIFWSDCKLCLWQIWFRFLAEYLLIRRPMWNYVTLCCNNRQDMVYLIFNALFDWFGSKYYVLFDYICQWT